jgi:hypothetical protein
MYIHHKFIEYTSQDFEYTCTSQDFEYTSQDFQIYITRFSNIATFHTPYMLARRKYFIIFTKITDVMYRVLHVKFVHVHTTFAQCDRVLMALVET